MNFLSHHHLDSRYEDSLFNFGLLLPDLVGALNKKIRIKRLLDCTYNAEGRQILAGVNQHLRRDEDFHHSVFFNKVTKEIKGVLPAYGFGVRPYRPFFISHLLSELFLDRYFLKAYPASADALYADLDALEVSQIEVFLSQAGQQHNIQPFITFLEKFRELRFIYGYAQPESIIYSLNRIFERVRNPKFEFRKNEELYTFVHSIDAIIQAHVHHL